LIQRAETFNGGTTTSEAMSVPYILAKLAYRYFYSTWNVHALRKEGFEFGYDDFLNHVTYKSDTFFVLGSGASINSYDEEDWDHISQHNSVGLNFWPVHDFVPDMLMFEIPRGSRQEEFFKLMRCKVDAYRGVPMIMKGSYKNKSDFGDMSELKVSLGSELINDIHIGKEVNIPGRNQEELRMSLSLLDKIGFFNQMGRLSTLGQYRGSVTCAIILGMKLGFKKIVLCGVDLNNTEYFYEQNKEVYLRKGIPVPTTGQSGPVHKTNIPLANRVLPISDAIELLNVHFVSKCEGEVLVMGSRSALFPALRNYREHFWR